MLETIIAGQSMMIPIMLLSVIGLGVFIERAWAFYENQRVDTRALRAQILKHLARGQVREAALLCANTPGPVSAVLLAGLQAYDRLTDRSPENLRAAVGETMDDYRIHGMSAVEKNLWMLTTVATSAPLFGMCGTVTGMIKSFAALAQMADTTQVGVGISEALITTAAGLIIALFTAIPYNYFSSLADKIEMEIDEAASEMLKFMTGEVGRASAKA